MYFKGVGVQRNYAEAVKWLRKAADQGISPAQSALGIMYFKGLGVRQDYVGAIKLFRLAADHGDAVGQFSLGVMYESGLGVQLNRAEALKLYRRAAGQGLPPAIARISEILADTPMPKGEVVHSPIPEVRIEPDQIGMGKSIRTNIPPTIDVASSMQTFDGTIQVTGKVMGVGKVSSLMVDGTPAPFNTDGSFGFSRAVPIGGSEIRLVATNEWGNTGEAIIQVIRTVSATARVAFPPLDPGRPKATQRPKAIALIIGIEKYENAPPAEFAENDARSFYDYAINALGVSPDRIRLLTGAEARRLDVQKVLRTWIKPLVTKGETDVFVFFSGHGLASEDGNDLFLLPYDTDRDMLNESAIRRKDMVDAFMDAGAASATLFLDTCYSGGTRGKDSLVISARPILVAAKKQMLPPNVTILAAAGNDQLSSTLPLTKHGLFSYFLMKGLEGEAAGSDSTITAATLEAYLSEKIPAEAAKLGRTQTPQLIGDEGRVVASW